MKQFFSFIETENERLKKLYPHLDEEKMILAKTVKCSEEFGELCNEILKNSSLQRKDKLETVKREDLEAEFADVILTTLLLAKSMNVDVEKALNQKIDMIKKRNY